MDTVVELAYFGGTADQNLVDVYEYSRAMQGLSRVTKVLGHYYLTGRIIHQAPSSEIDLYVRPPERGSFKQQVYSTVVGGIILCPINYFMIRAMDSWLPSIEKAETMLEVNVDRTDEVRSLEERYADKSPDERAIIEACDAEIGKRQAEIDVIRSIVSSSFKDIFRPISRGVDCAQMYGKSGRVPTKPIVPETVALIETDIRNEQIRTINARVTSFSRGAKAGAAFSSALGRGFRFEYLGQAGKLPAQDIFSWSQYHQKDIIMEGEFVTYFDGTLKKMIVYFANYATTGDPTADQT